MKPGKVYLVGAGPGDPGLITVKGLECLRQADVIVYDRLLDESLLEVAFPGAERIYVGKSSDFHIMEQDNINRLLIEKAREGKTVVRLKGGDPFVLGRGGEEAEELVWNHIPFEVVPGISSSVAVPAYAGIPVTHRHVASSFTVVTGHESAEKDKSIIHWDKVNRGADTIIFLMAVSNLEYIIDGLLKGGRPSFTPVAMIVNGTTSRQYTLTGTLEDIVTKARMENLKPPAVIVVGEVVRLRERIRWFDKNPLFGKWILVTRPKQQSGEIVRLLRSCGATPVEMPVIEILPLQDTTEIDGSIRNIENYDWIVFTSVNGVDAFFKRLDSLGLDTRWLGKCKIAVIGPATAGALEKRGIRADCVPEKYTSKGLLEELGKIEVTGKRFLLPRADIAGNLLSSGLSRLGAEVTDIPAYRTVAGKEGLSEGKQLLLEHKIDIIAFTSSSTVVNMIKTLGDDFEVINRTVVACIGPETASKAAETGLRVDIVAETNTIPGLIEAMEQYFQEKEP